MKRGNTARGLKFQVVEFDDKTVQAIPVQWLINKNTQCLWPPTPPAKLIKTCAKPGPNWIICNVSRLLFKETDNYLHARELEKIGECESSIETSDYEPDNKTRKIRKKAHTTTNLTDSDRESTEGSEVDKLSLGDSDDDNNAIQNIHGAPVSHFILVGDGTPSSSKAITGSQSTSQEVISSVPERCNPESNAIFGSSNHNITDPGPSVILEPLRANEAQTASPTTPFNLSRAIRVNRFATQDDEQHTCVTCQPCLLRQREFERKLFGLLAEIRSDVRSLKSQDKRNLEQSQTSMKNLIPFELPINNEDDLTQLDKWIQETSNFSIIVQYVSIFGGENLGKVVRNVLKQMISSHLARRINFIGKNSKISFKNLKLLSVVIDATRSNKGCNDSKNNEIEKIIQNWFRNSRDLDGRAERNSKNVVLSQSPKTNQQ